MFYYIVISMIETNRHIEEEKKKTKQKQLDQEHYEKTTIESQIKIEIQELKHLVEVWVIDKNLFSEIIEDKHISHKEFNEVLSTVDIEKLFEKLDEIEKTKDIDELIPKEHRVKKEEYLNAFKDEKIKENVLKKFNNSLDRIHNSLTGGQTFHGNPFSTYTYMLSQKLIVTQENIIDLKEPLTLL